MSTIDRIDSPLPDLRRIPLSELAKDNNQAVATSVRRLVPNDNDTPRVAVASFQSSI